MEGCYDRDDRVKTTQERRSELDQYSAAELVEIYYLARSSMDAQFQFWVSITFAVIVAAFVARSRLSRTLRILISLLYLLATVNLTVLFFGDAATGVYALSVLDNGDAANLILRPGSNLLVPTRAGLFVLGTLSALYFLMRSYQPDLNADT